MANHISPVPVIKKGLFVAVFGIVFVAIKLGAVESHDGINGIGPKINEFMKAASSALKSEEGVKDFRTAVVPWIDDLFGDPENIKIR